MDAGLADIDTFASAYGDQDPAALKALLQRTAWENLIVARSLQSLDRLLKDIGDIEQPMSAVKTPHKVVETLEAGSLLGR